MGKREPVYMSGTETHQPLFSAVDDAHTLLDLVMESSFDGLYITDAHAKTLYVNSSYEVLSGLRREQVLGKSMHELVESGLISHSATLLALQRGEAVTVEQTFVTGKHAISTSTPTFDSHQRIVMVVTNVRDVTELHELKEQLSQKELLAQRYCSETELIRRQLLGDHSLIVEDHTTLELLRLVTRVAALDTTVLLLGETGVGKERIAAYIHSHSLRKDACFIKVNCGAIPAHLMESELFGYVRGAFTGANKEGKAGLFEVANKGTIFLDEVGELPIDLQVKLLRVLQEREVERIGATKPLPIDVRVLAATNRNLEEMLRNKTFREDLYYRLSVFPVTIPPLRDRRGDILPLAVSMLHQLNKKYHLRKQFTYEAESQLLAYNWPGNVRELKNIVERSIIMSVGDWISAGDLLLRAPDMASVTQLDVRETVNLKALVAKLELDYMLRAYERYGNVRDAAQSLQMDPSTFVRKRRKHQGTSMLQE